MPMMLDQQLALSTTRPEGQLQGRQTYYGHPRRQATKCGHIIHPSASEHTPSCPTCITSRAKANMNAALKGLIAEGGPAPSVSMRDRRWQRVKLRYEIVKQRQAKSRSRDQLREEREQAWDEAHQIFESQRLQATATFQIPVECPICASMRAIYPTSVSNMQAARDTTWWERPDGLVADHILVPRTPLRPVQHMQQDTYKAKGYSVLRGMVRDFRRALTASEAHKQIWESRYRTESAVRRKHSLGEGYHFEPNFWDSPISAHLSRQFHQRAMENERMAARRVRGNTQRPKPPRSSLSYSERSDEVDIDDSRLKYIWKMEELEMLERRARKVGEEVGYLYFVGEVDGLLEWREDYFRSDRQLVYRERVAEPESEGLTSTSDSDESSDSEDSEDDKDEDGTDKEEDYEDMDIDG